MRNKPLTLVFTALVVLIAAAAAAGPLQDDLKARRARAMERLGPDAMAIFWSAPERVYSTDVNYEFRQDSNLLYLSGIDQEETILVLMPGNETRKEVLFVRDADPRREHWNGHSLTPDEASAASGIQTVMTVAQFEPFVAAVLSKRAPGGSSATPPTEYARFFQALSDGRARLALLLEPQATLSTPPGPVTQFASSMRERFFGFTVQDATPIVADLRQIKTSYEQNVLRTTQAISSEAHRAGMRTAAPGKYEYEVEAAIEEVYLRNGAMSWGYPSIVGSGPNATVLHYHEGDRQMKDGELLLVDAACNFGYLSGDITRTYPVSGKFSPAQREIYQLVLEAQADAIRAARPGSTLQDIHASAVATMKTGLLRLGLITDASGEQYRTWFTHGTSHYIGIDVHDVGDNKRPLEAGMTFTIEPGLYIRQSALDTLPRTPENLAFIDKVQAAVKKYQDIGVRIEDSFLLEESGARNLSAALPKNIDEVEALMRGAK